MPEDVSGDQLALIKIEGMHCHKCEQTIRKALTQYPGVHEVEVDFPSRQASVLYDASQLTVNQLLEAVTEAGYRTTGFSTRQHVEPGGGLLG
jgi:copper chaperone CopZ